MDYTLKAGIYLITNTKNSKNYTGKDINITTKRRWRQHKSELNAGTHGNSHLQASWRLYGEVAFTCSILEYVEIRDRDKDPEGYKEDCKYLASREDWWMDLLGTLDKNKGYNKKKSDGTEVSEETRKKHSIRMMGNQYTLGHKQTPEHIAKSAATRRGKKQSEETKKKRSITLMGHKNNTPEACAKMSIVRTGKKQSPETVEKRVSQIRGRKMPPRTTEHCANLAAANTGRKQSPETIAKRIATRKRNQQQKEEL